MIGQRYNVRLMTQSPSCLADRILAYMQAPSPVQRMFRRQELDSLGPAHLVGEALTMLEQTHRIGSPGHDIWFPLEPHATAFGGVQYDPPESIRDMAEALLRREGVPIVSSPQAHDYRLFHSSHGRQGVWGVPSFEDIGVDQPVSLSLQWGRGRVHTVYKEERSMPQGIPTYLPDQIPNPNEFRLLASRAQTSVTRLEKDVWVNRTLRILGDTPSPTQGLLLFWGGTSLTKAWRLTPRFSEDIDLRFQGPETYSLLIPESLKRSVHAYVRDTARDLIASQLPGGQLSERQSSYLPLATIQHVLIQYASYFRSEPGIIQLQLMFLPGQVPWSQAKVYAHPTPDPHQRNQVLAYLPCVPSWATMTGKLHALATLPANPGMAEMRHIVDLGTWLAGESRVEIYPFMMQQSRAEFCLPHLRDGLLSNVNRLAQDPECARRYDEYVTRMFPGNLLLYAPDYQESLSAIQNLWHDMCKSNWDHPDCVMTIPDIESYVHKPGGSAN